LGGAAEDQHGSIALARDSGLWRDHKSFKHASDSNKAGCGARYVARHSTQVH
jgi:hypothetical protein